MSYIISNGKHYVARAYMGTTMARDYVARLDHEYGGRITASGCLSYDYKEGAEAYIERNSVFLDAVLPGAEPYEYDPCSNCLIGNGG